MPSQPHAPNAPHHAGAPLAPGTRLGHYVLQCPIGQGGFGVVYRAHHVQWPGRLVAIKVPRDQNAAAALLRAGHLQGRIDHPGVVKVLDVDSGAQPYLVLEWIEGETLAQRIGRTGPLPVAHAAAVLDHIAEALERVHAGGACHGDLKPSNILMGVDGRIAVTDFGGGPSLAEIRRGLDWSLGSVELPAAVGTLAYMAPEQREGRVPDAAGDLYSLGAIWFEMLTGRLPALSDRLADPTADALYRALCAPLGDRLVSLADLRARLRALGAPPRSVAPPLAQPFLQQPAPAQPMGAFAGQPMSQPLSQPLSQSMSQSMSQSVSQSAGGAFVPAEFRRQAAYAGDAFVPAEFRQQGVSAHVPGFARRHPTEGGGFNSLGTERSINDGGQRLMRRAWWLFALWLSFLTACTGGLAGGVIYLLWRDGLIKL